MCPSLPIRQNNLFCVPGHSQGATAIRGLPVGVRVRSTGRLLLQGNAIVGGRFCQMFGKDVGETILFPHTLNDGSYLKPVFD